MSYKIVLDVHGDPLGLILSKAMAPTLKEDPAEAEVVSHKLLIRAGFIRKLAAGIYSYLPFGLRSLRKVERIVRREMNRAGALELLLPAVQPGELWQESGRWDFYGKELLRFKDRHERDYVIGPTHEEVITDIARREIRSFRDLPLNLYQVQTKFRDEIRPRFGLMRGREFIMKDAYSFDADEEGADKSYWAMYKAYQAIFNSCGLNFATVEADSGAIGGSFSHEFMVLAATGEDGLASCPSCSYAANVEKAELKNYSMAQSEVDNGPMQKVPTPGCRHVPELAVFLKVPLGKIIKAMIFDGPDGPMMILMPGDREINLIKLKNALGGFEPRLLSPEEAEKLTGVPMGFVGPASVKIPIWADLGVERLGSGIIGAGEADQHFINAQVGRDFQVKKFLDLAIATEGDPCPKCGGALEIKRGIEVGHVFKLGLKYSKALSATFTQASGQEAPLVMGCYGIGIGRTMAAAIEQNHDKDGIIWPMALAPYEAAILPLQVQSEKVMTAAYKLFQDLMEQGMECVLDDRDERAGLKFKDADLIGYPLRITVSEKSLAEGKVELKLRQTKEVFMLPLEEAAQKILQLKKDALATSNA